MEKDIRLQRFREEMEAFCRAELEKRMVLLTADGDHGELRESVASCSGSNFAGGSIRWGLRSQKCKAVRSFPKRSLDTTGAAVRPEPLR